MKAFLAFTFFVSVALAAVPKYTSNTPLPYTYSAPEEVKFTYEPLKIEAKHYDNMAYIPIVRTESHADTDNYNYFYETGNGIYAQATGSLKNLNDVNFITVEGQFQYPGGVNGEPIYVAYTADENGYHPRSNILPTPPPIPAYVSNLVKYLAEHGATGSP